MIHFFIVFECKEDSHCNGLGTCKTIQNLKICDCDDPLNEFQDCSSKPNFNLTLIEYFQSSKLSSDTSLFSGCPHPHWIGDSFCDDKTNIADCDYDGGDCCANINTDYCEECKCYHEDNCVLGYTPSVVGDSFCNDETNIANCNYDGGDCCERNINSDFCSDCKCYFNESCVAGIHPLVGDGFCNDQTNNEICNYDGGDCCGSCVLNNQCTQCACLAGANVTNILIGNGFCNNEFNNADCYFDGGDCCKSFVIIDL